MREKRRAMISGSHPARDRRTDFPGGVTASGLLLALALTFALALAPAPTLAARAATTGAPVPDAGEPPESDSCPPQLRAILCEVNLARARPEIYAAVLEGWLQWIRGDRLCRPGTRPLRLREGRAAVAEAVRFLREQEPRSPLCYSPGMSLAAADLLRDQARTGRCGHVARDGTGVAERLRRHGRWERRAAELIQYGGADARAIVALLIVDDGVPRRGHRFALFDPEYRRLGIAFGPHARYRRTCVLTLAAEFEEAPALAEGP